MLNKKQANLQQRNVVEKYCIEKSPIAWNTMRFVCIIRQNFTFPFAPNYLQQNIVHPFSVHSLSNKVLNSRLPFSLRKCLYVLLKQYFCRNVCNGRSKYFDAWHYVSVKLKIDIQTHNCKLVYYTIKMSSPIAIRLHDDFVAESAFVKRRFTWQKTYCLWIDQMQTW